MPAMRISDVALGGEEAWELMRRGEKTCELRRLDSKRAAVAPGDLIAFSQTGSPDNLLAARVTECRVARTMGELLLDDAVLRGSGFGSLDDAVDGMGEIYGRGPYEALGIFVDASD